MTNDVEFPGVRAAVIVAISLVLALTTRGVQAQSSSHGAVVPTSPPIPQVQAAPPARSSTPPAVRPKKTFVPKHVALPKKPTITGDNRIAVRWQCTSSSKGRSMITFSADGTLQSSDSSRGTWAWIGDSTAQVIFSGVDDTYFADVSADAHYLTLSTVSETGVSTCSRM